MSLTSTGLKLDLHHYKYLKELANQKFDGNLSALIRNYLPKLPKTIQEEYQ